MTIDIITYTDAQFAALTEEQLLEVKSAQLKKNRLDSKLEEEMLAEKHRLIDNGVFLSGIWEAYCEKLRTEHAQEVESIREALLFYLRFTSKAEESQAAAAPYVVNYALSMEERTSVVKTYYESAYDDATERLEAFAEDEVAVQYLGEMYSPMYEYFLRLTKETS